MIIIIYMQAIIISLLILFSCGLYGQSAEENLQAGIKAFAEENLAEAETLFLAALESDATDPHILSNIALIKVEEKAYIEAYAYWRKALHHDPSFSAAKQGIAYLEAKNLIQVRHSNSLSSFFESIYRSPPIYTYLVIWIFLFLFLRISYRYLLQKKQSKEEELPPPSVPYNGIFYGLALVVCSAFAYQQIVERSLQKAMVLSPVTTRLGPSGESPSLFPLSPGDLVSVLSKDSDWLQVQTKNEQRAWVEKDKIFIF